jgi:hypothetical protein
MSEAIIIQIIETLGLIISPLMAILIGYICLRKLYKLKERFDSEAEVLNEIVFYRHVLCQYTTYCKGIGGGKEMKQEFWRRAREELDMNTPRRTEPRRIKDRLKQLGADSKAVEALIDSVSST